MQPEGSVDLLLGGGLLALDDERVVEDLDLELLLGVARNLELDHELVPGLVDVCGGNERRGETGALDARLIWRSLESSFGEVFYPESHQPSLK